jgi:hypothetical protein
MSTSKSYEDVPCLPGQSRLYKSDDSDDREDECIRRERNFRCSKPVVLDSPDPSCNTLSLDPLCEKLKNDLHEKVIYGGYCTPSFFEGGVYYFQKKLCLAIEYKTSSLEVTVCGRCPIDYVICPSDSDDKVFVKGGGWQCGHTMSIDAFFDRIKMDISERV